MFYCTPERFYRSTLLDRESWLIHAFGTRLNENPLGDYTKVKQVHSAEVVPAAHARKGTVEADGLIAGDPGEKVGIRTADCVPLLLADPKQRIVAAIHAGWRGTVGRISAEAVERLAREYGSDPADLLAVIGPAIGACCFEVGPEVAEHFDSEHVLHHQNGGRPKIDLVAANRKQLEASGIEPRNIDEAGLCTVCGREMFHSFRRDREASGRMTAVIGVTS